MSPAPSWPGFEAYNAALLSGGILDPELAGARPALNGWGQPSAISGGFAFTYRMNRPGAVPKALRLFHSGAAERRAAMAAAYRAVDAARREGPLARFLVPRRRLPLPSPPKPFPTGNGVSMHNTPARLNPSRGFPIYRGGHYAT